MAAAHKWLRNSHVMWRYQAIFAIFKENSMRRIIYPLSLTVIALTVSKFSRRAESAPPPSLRNAKKKKFQVK